MAKKEKRDLDMVKDTCFTLDDMDKIRENSEIIKFYENKSFLITGATGFLGKVLIEKLLRTLVNFGKIFILVRPKKNVQPQERLQELLKSPLFDSIREKNLASLSKVIAVEGDVEKVDMGLSDENLSLILEQVSVVFNSAATVRFDGPLKSAIDTNLIGTKNVIDFCLKIKNLVSLVHISTAYTNYEHLIVDEHIYPANMEPERLIEISKLMDQDTVEVLKKKLLKKKPNTYTFTKSEAEWYLLDNAKDLPVVICRPTIVSCSWREPFAGFVDNYNAPTLYFLSVGIGVMRTVLAEPKNMFDLVPVDTVINQIVALGWFAHIYYENERKCNTANGKSEDKIMVKNNAIENDRYATKINEFNNKVLTVLVAKKLPSRIARIPVFHCGSSVSNPIEKWRAMSLNCNAWAKYPSITNQLLPKHFPFTANKYLNELLCVLLHTIPGYVFDFLMFLHGKPRRFVKTAKYINKASYESKAFGFKDWKFRINNSRFLFNQILNKEDRLLFNWELKDLDWEEYFTNYVRGMRRFTLKEADSDLDKAREKLKHTYYRNTTLQVLVFLFLFYFFIPYSSISNCILNTVAS